MVIKKFAASELCQTVSEIFQIQKDSDRKAVLTHLNGYLSGTMDSRKCLLFFEKQYRESKNSNSEASPLWDQICSVIESDIQNSK